MKLLFASVFSFLFFYSCFAQEKWIKPLPCDTWGPDQFLSYAEVEKRLLAQGELVSASEHPQQKYDQYGQGKGAYFWSEGDSYINNIQIVRWTILNRNASYEFIVTDIYDEELYRVSGENVCGVIIFPDSSYSEHVLHISLKRADGGFDLSTRDFSRISLSKPKDPVKRLSILRKVQACSTLTCKIEILKSYKKTLDIFTLLELEKMKDPTNQSVDALYWDMVSKIRYYRSSFTELR